MSHLSYSCRNFSVAISCAWLLSTPTLAGDKVQGKRYFELRHGSHYAAAHDLCVAAAKERHDDKYVEFPMDRVVNVRDDGESVWCNLVDANGNEGDQHYGSQEWECPTNSERANDGCECEPGYESAGDTCKKESTLVSNEEPSITPQNADRGDEKPHHSKRPPLLVQVEIKSITGEAGGWRQLEQPSRASYGAIGIITEGGGYEGVATYDRLTGKVELKVSKIGEGSSDAEVYQIGQISPSELADITAKSGGKTNKFGNLIEEPIRKLVSDATGQKVLDPGKSASKTGVDWRPQQPPLPHVK